MKMHLLSGGRLSMQRSVYYPDAEPGEWFEMPVSCALFRHRQGIALFDTGCHPDAADRAAERWGAEAADYSKPIFRREDAVIGQLPLTGLAAQDVDLVICSHLHYDHCGCNVFFDRATVICHTKELAAARAEDAEAQGILRSDWDVGLPIQTIDGAHDVFGDGRLTLIPLPGHTPGSMGAHAVLDRSGSFLLASDAAPVAASLIQRTVPTNTWQPTLYLASLEEIARHAEQGATVIFGHDDAQWRSLRTGADFYD
jgi:glyoxylase-like metal-dependent hydrolase (beta-lactamase superfamily II)